MAAGKVWINGVDILATYGAYTPAMPDPPSPSMRVRVNREYSQSPRPKRVTQEFDGKSLVLGLMFLGASNDAIQINMAAVAALCGAQGAGVRPVTVKVVNSLATGADGTTSVTYVCVLESFDVELVDPIHIQRATFATLRFAILDVQSSGATTQTATIPSASGFQNNYYFADANCVQGSTPMKIEMVGGFLAPFYVQHLAVEPELIYSPSGFTKNGNVAIVDGQYGFPAASFAASGASLSYPAINTLALGNNSRATIVIRFKRNYATNDATNKYLFQCTTTPLSVHIAATTQLITLTFPVSGGTSTVTLDGSTISNSAWNTIIVRIGGSVIGLQLTVNGVTTGDGNSGANAFINGIPGGSIYIGNSAAGAGPCKSYVSEFAVYTHSLTDEQVSALQALAISISEAYQINLNRNLTFLLDFSKGFYYKCNRGNQVSLLNGATATERVTFDSLRQAARRFTTTSGANSDISGEIILYRGYGKLFTANLHNKFVLGCSNSDSVTYRFTYEPRSRW